MWLNVRESAWRRFDKLARKMNWEPAKAIGKAVMVLRDSQEKQQVEATAEEIFCWSEIEDQDAQRFLDAMIWAGLLERVKTPNVEPLVPTYRIVGNELEVELKMDYAERGKLGGEKTRKAWEAYRAGMGPHPVTGEFLKGQKNSPQGQAVLLGGASKNQNPEIPETYDAEEEGNEGQVRANRGHALGARRPNGMEGNGIEWNGKEEIQEGTGTNENGSAANASRRADDLPAFHPELLPDADDEPLIDAALMGLDSPEKRVKPRTKPKGPVFELCTPQILADAMLDVEQKTQELWLSQYEGHEDWLRRTLMDAYGWTLRNAHKAPKSRWGDFYSRWLRKDFESYRKGLPSARLSRADQSALTGLQQLEMVRRGEL